MIFADVYRGKNVLVTGHTGFKGSWLGLWLRELGANVLGISLPPEANPNHWDLLNLDMESHYLDIRNLSELRKRVLNFQPDIVFHLAAQPLVRKSYSEPLNTWSTNVIGTANLLEVCRELPNLQAVVCVTTDKCYENKEWLWGYREIDALGGHDPYSASKAGAELVANSYRRSYFFNRGDALIATARAGNVIGGGDWSEDRLIPDLFRSMQNNVPLLIRSPGATRPWQHVLECLSGYLRLGENLLTGNADFAEPWNFGPEREGNKEVREVLATLKSTWKNFEWTVEENSESKLHEATLLHLDSSKSKELLGWNPVWGFEVGVKKTGEWYREYQESGKILSTQQIHDYVSEASRKRMDWASN